MMKKRLMFGAREKVKQPASSAKMYLSVMIGHSEMIKAADTNKHQKDRFEQAARDLGVELDEEKLKDTLRKVGYHDALILQWENV